VNENAIFAPKAAHYHGYETKAALPHLKNSNLKNILLNIFVKYISSYTADIRQEYFPIYFKLQDLEPQKYIENIFCSLLFQQ
jgi:hypothetical protein